MCVFYLRSFVFLMHLISFGGHKISLLIKMTLSNVDDRKGGGEALQHLMGLNMRHFIFIVFVIIFHKNFQAKCSMSS